MLLHRVVAPFGVLLLAALPCGTAVAQSRDRPCPQSIDDFEVIAGELRPGIECGTFFGSTDANSNVFSYGHFRLRQRVELPYEVEVTWQRLGDDSWRPLELILVGVYVLFKDGAYALYSSEGKFAEEGWLSLPTLRTRQQTHIRVRHDEKTLSLWIGGDLVHTWPFTTKASAGVVSVALKGESGYRSRMLFKGLGIRSAIEDERSH